MKIIITENQLKFILDNEVIELKKRPYRACGNNPNETPCFSYEKSKKIMDDIPFNEKPKTVNQYIEWRNSNSNLSDERLKGLPFRPDTAYKKKGWISWGEFLNIRTLPYEEAKECVLLVKNSTGEVPTLKTFSMWRKKHMDKYECLRSINDDLGKFYRKEFKLLGKDKTFNFTEFIGEEYWDYEKAKIRVQELINQLPKEERPNSKSYRRWYRKYEDKKGFEDLKFIPAAPLSVYTKEGKLKGVFSWMDFLGKDDFFTYQEAINYLRNLNIPDDEKPRGNPEFVLWYDKNVGKKGFEDLVRIPRDVYKYYSRRGINVDWREFMGVSDTTYAKQMNKELREDKNKWLSKLFKLDSFKQLHCFSGDFWERMGQQGKDKILSIDCEETYRELIPDGYIPKYCYDKVKYKRRDEKILIGCKIHSNHFFNGSPIKGYFLQIPGSHEQGNGCPICGFGESGGESLIKFTLTELGIGFNPPSSKNLIPGCIGGEKNCQLKHDFNLTGEFKNIYIEFDGNLHFQAYGKAESGTKLRDFINTIKRDHQRNEYFINNNKNLKLIRVSYLSTKNLKNILTKEFLEMVRDSKSSNIFTCPFPYTPIESKYLDLINQIGIRTYGDGTILNPNTYQPHPACR